MKSILHKSLAIASIVGLAANCLAPSDLLYASDTIINMQIAGGTVSITSPASFTYSTVLNISFDTQVLEQEFTGASNYFVVQDTKGSDTGYNTTLQLSGNMLAGAHSIASSNVEFKTSSTSVVVMSGVTNPNVQIDSNSASYQSLNSSRNYIYRSNGANTGAVGRYGQSIWMKINVPANQPAGSYAGTLVYTLIEN